MPSDVEHIPEAKEWEDNSETDRWPGLPWKALRSTFGLGGLRSVLWPARTAVNGQPEKLRPTAWLDGLRGFAALLVYWHHHELWARTVFQTDYIQNGFGYRDQYFFCAFPFVRNFFGGGHYAVSTFYVISGYVLSAKPLSLIHAAEQAKLADNLASALFRRWLRLYIPLICTTFIYMTSWHVFGFWIDGANPKATYGEELWSWYAEFKNFSFVFRDGGDPWFSYNFHLWSIPVEFRGSVVIYTALLAFSRCTRNARLWLQVGLIVYFLYIVDGWYCALFTSGMLLCDLELLAAKNELPHIFERLRPYKKLIFYHLFLISFYLGGVPETEKDIPKLRATTGWYYLSFLKPQAVFDYKWFFLFWAAFLLVASIPHVPWLKRFFETRFCQFLGRVSYSLYLVHGPVLRVLGDRVYAMAGWVTPNRTQHMAGILGMFPLPKFGPMGLEIAFLVPNLILLPVTLYVAEICTRVFDEPSVRLPQALYKLTMEQPARLPA